MSLKVVAPQASLPTLQLSLQRGLDPAAHLALAPLRDEGGLINMGLFGHPKAPGLSGAFDRWLGQAVTGAAARADPGRVVFQDQVMGAAVSAVQLG